MTWTWIAIALLAFLGVVFLILTGRLMGRGRKVSSPGVAISGFCGLMFLTVAILSSTGYFVLPPPEIRPTGQVVQDEGRAKLEANEIYECAVSGTVDGRFVAILKTRWGELRGLEFPGYETLPLIFKRGVDKDGKPVYSPYPSPDMLAKLCAALTPPVPESRPSTATAPASGSR